jgi:hypothetical protein
MQSLEFRSKQCIHITHMKVSPKITTIYSFSYHRVQHELLLQTKFEFIHKQVFLEFNSAAKISESSNNDTRYHDEART